MKPRHWTTLVQSLKHGRCILVLGNEVTADSSNSGPGDDLQQPLPNPVIFAHALTENLEKELKENNANLPAADSLAGVAQQYEDTYGFGAAALRSQATAYYASLRLKPSKDHEALASLPLPLIVSTSQDLLLSDALTQAGKEHRVYRFNLRGNRRENKDFPPPTLSDPVIYHLFGTFRDPQSLVLSENDLLDFLAKLASKQLPDSLLSRFHGDNVSLLFVGCAIRFWYQRVLLKALIRSVSVPLQASNAVAVEPLFQTIPDPERTQTILYYQRGTSVEVIDDDISHFVSELLQKLKEAGGVSTETSAAVGPQVTVFVSYAKENHELAVALTDALKEARLTPWLDVDDLRSGEDWERRVQDELEAVDYVLVLVTPELVEKFKGFVNVEIHAALKRAEYYRGTPFVIPLMSDRLGPDERIPELRKLHETPLREASLRTDVAALAKELRRELERRNKK